MLPCEQVFVEVMTCRVTVSTAPAEVRLAYMLRTRVRVSTLLISNQIDLIILETSLLPHSFPGLPPGGLEYISRLAKLL